MKIRAFSELSMKKNNISDYLYQKWGFDYEKRICRFCMRSARLPH